MNHVLDVLEVWRVLNKRYIRLHVPVSHLKLMLWRLFLVTLNMNQVIRQLATDDWGVCASPLPASEAAQMQGPTALMILMRTGREWRWLLWTTWKLLVLESAKGGWWVHGPVKMDALRIGKLSISKPGVNTRSRVLGTFWVLFHL